MNSFNDIYSKTEEKFYYGMEPTKELEAFLNENHPPQGEALDIGSGEGRNTLLLTQYGYHVHTVDYSSEGLHKLEKYARSKNLNNIEIVKYDDSHGEPHYHGVARLIGIKPIS